MFASTQAGGVDFCLVPDFCKTPPTAIPLPYPNMAEGAIGVPPVPNVLFAGAPAHNLLTEVPVSSLDEAGAMGGIISGIIKGPARPLTGAFTVLVGGLPCHRLTTINLQNLCNTVGMRVAPSQGKVLVLAP